MDRQSQLFANAYKLMFLLDKHYNLLKQKRHSIPTTTFWSKQYNIHKSSTKVRNQNLEKHNYSHLQILFDKFQHTKDGILILFTATVNTEQLAKKIFSKITDSRMKFCKKGCKIWSNERNHQSYKCDTTKTNSYKDREQATRHLSTYLNSSQWGPQLVYIPTCVLVLSW